ncbi:histone deacetylase [Sedimenticola thiotaurini]|uniref:Histone deacetylase n=1 Tax=Sedimenticola thiotaurini TaxID=1543721 RepID=A0A0F7JSB7_9GAMM|nr:histone deacetylase [Sedimenticola thiotaurini]AKH19381.1 histone deacetylase [Sedimenticola thiotaurini]
MFIYAGKSLARYGFGNDHPLGSDRFDTFWHAFQQSTLPEQCTIRTPVQGSADDARLFHTTEYVERVRQLSSQGAGMLDADTPVFPGIFEAALVVVGSVLDGAAEIVAGNTTQAFVPIAGLHHASRGSSAGFCVFNDCAIAIEALRQRHGIKRILYVDIDAHHGDGVYYAFEEDPDLFFIDLHEDGRHLFPGTGDSNERGTGPARGTKLNIPLPPGAQDREFFQHWPAISRFLDRIQPEFIILQCGADCLAGDPITHLKLSDQVHYQTARRLAEYARICCDGRLLALGGGGYNRANIARGWLQTIRGLLDA